MEEKTGDSIIRLAISGLHIWIIIVGILAIATAPTMVVWIVGACIISIIVSNLTLLISAALFAIFRNAINDTIGLATEQKSKPEVK